MMGFSDSKPVKLYLRLPVKIIDEQQVRDLHPGILNVTLPRQKSRRWCIIDFCGTREIKSLKRVKVGGRKVVVQLKQ